MNIENKLLEEVKKHLPQMQIEQLQEQLNKIPELEKEVEQKNELICAYEKNEKANEKVVSEAKSLNADLEIQITELKASLDRQALIIQEILPFKEKADLEKAKYELETERDKVAFMNNTLSKIFASPVYEQRVSIQDNGSMSIPTQYGGCNSLPYNHHQMVHVSNYKNHVHGNAIDPPPR